MTQKVKVKINGTIKNLELNPEQVLCRALSIAQSRDDVLIDSLTSMPITPVPLSIFHEYRTMRKTYPI